MFTDYHGFVTSEGNGNSSVEMVSIGTGTIFGIPFVSVGRLVASGRVVVVVLFQPYGGKTNGGAPTEVIGRPH